jgi:predicted LPLAT superfamily acyltransferase
MSTHWSSRPEGGGRFAIWLLVKLCLHLGRGTARFVLYPATWYFYLRRAPERKASYEFLTVALGRKPSQREMLRHWLRYGTCMIDRIFLLAERFRRFDIRVHGIDELLLAMNPGRGVMLLGAHIGSFEALRVLSLERPDVQVRVVMDKGQTPAMTQLLHALNPSIADAVIDASQDSTAVVLALSEAADQGALIALLGDRARPGEATVDCEFFGKPAPFPVAPLLIAATLKMPVVLCIGLFRGGNSYDLYFELFSEQLHFERRERQSQVQATVQRYAQRLEHYTRLDPFNWFNFYDFWQSAARKPVP